MTDKQFKIFRRTFVGAALFIGGVLLYTTTSWWRGVFMLAGIIMMFAEELQLRRFIEWFMAPVKTEDKKKDNNNETN